MSPPPLCPYCHHPMQLLTALVENEQTVSEQFICACKGSVYYLNIHQGDQTREETK